MLKFVFELLNYKKYYYKMKTKLVLLCALFAFALTAKAQNFPNVTVENEKGAKVETSSLVDGKTPFVVSFWSTTCKPCIQEIDAINEAYPDWIEEVDFRMVVVSIDDARSSSRAKSMTKGRGWTDFTLLFDPNQDFKRAMNVIYTPQVYIFDKDGNKIYEHNGYNPGCENEIIEKLLSL